MIEAVRVEDLSHCPAFRDLRNLVLSRLTGVVEGVVKEMSDSDISKIIPTEGMDLRKDLESMLQIEGLLLQLLREIGHLNYGALQFPANIRTIGTGDVASRAFNAQGYATDLIHCDAWSGAPSDSWNHLIYLLHTPGAPYLEIFETLPPDSPLRDYRGDYRSAEVVSSQLRQVSAIPASGVMVVWPTYTPHRTVVPTDSEGLVWRVSVDFRTRLGSPYDGDQNRSSTSFSKSQMNSDGLYWAFPSHEFGSMETKVSFELRQAARHGTDALAKRDDYIRRYYPKFLRG